MRTNASLVTHAVRAVVISVLSLAFCCVVFADTSSPDASQSQADAIMCDEYIGDGPLIWRLKALRSAKLAVQQNDPAVMPAYHSLMADAAMAYLNEPYSVTHKLSPPPSGDVHDYTSLGPYWWPNPKTKSGLPYVRRDGEINPERSGVNFDRTRSGDMVHDVTVLTLGAWFSGEHKYADKAAEMLHVWFVDPKTRMNPNLNYGQSIPGKTKGRGIGIIDTSYFVDVVDSARLLSLMGSLDPATEQGLKVWFGEYTRWLIQSSLGKDERAAKNNHGTFYDVQVASFALMAGDCAIPARILNDTKKRIDAQITSSGRMPLEEKRTRSLHYYSFNTLAFLQAARLGEHVGVDLYRYQGASGGHLKGAIDYLSEYSGREEDWPHATLGDRADKALWQVLLMASRAYADTDVYEAVGAASGLDLRDRAILLNWAANEQALSE